MRRLVAAFVVAALAASLTACGGGGASTTSESAASSPPPEAASAPKTATPAASVPKDVSPTQTADYVALVGKGVKAPTSVTERVKAKQPFILAFYDKSQPVTKQQEAIVAAVMKKYRGMVDLVSFDIGKYASGSSGSLPEVDEALLKDKTAANAISLAESLGIKFTPYIVVVDKYGYITYRGQGLVDGSMLEREVLRVGE